MSRISMLRTMVNNGWTIANRRAVTSQIGKANFEELSALAKKAGISGDTFEYRAFKDDLTPEKLDNTRTLLNECIQDSKRAIDKEVQKWGRELHFGKGNWNSEYYGEYRGLCTTGKDIEVAGHLSSEDIRKREIFAKCKELGCDEIQYRGERYIGNKPHYEYLTKLKKGDTYTPHSSLWTSDTAEYAYGTYGTSPNPLVKNVRYEILCNPKTKVIQTSFAKIDGGIATECILPPYAKYKVLNTEMSKDGILNLRLEVIS